MAETLLFKGVPSNEVNGLRVRLGHNVETLAGTKTLVPQDAQFQLLDCGGSGRTLVLPAEEASQGLFFVVKNTSDAAEAIAVTNDAAGPIDTIGKNEFCVFVCDGSSWVSGVGQVAWLPAT
tara:strand:+ start:536 stop:898 length:363 start_codon:yes stop_codon:yes gene_type:complete